MCCKSSHDRRHILNVVCQFRYQKKPQCCMSTHDYFALWITWILQKLSTIWPRKQVCKSDVSFSIHARWSINLEENIMYRIDVTEDWKCKVLYKHQSRPTVWYIYVCIFYCMYFNYWRLWLSHNLCKFRMWSPQNTTMASILCCVDMWNISNENLIGNSWNVPQYTLLLSSLFRFG